MATQENFNQSEQDRGLARRSAIDRKRPAASGELTARPPHRDGVQPA